MIRPTKWADTGYTDGYHYVHNGGSGCVGWTAEGVNTQHTIEDIELPAAMIDVTYNVVFNGNVVATATIAQGVGDAPALPSSIDYAFTTYTYDVDEITAGTTTVTATPVFNMPFEASTDYASAKWYYMNGHGSYSDQYVSTNGDAIVWAQGNALTEAYEWAFIGNPIEGIAVINKAAGEGKYIQGTDPATMGTDMKRWTLKQQTITSYQAGDKGFGLYDATLTYLNTQAGTLKYWGYFDEGSTFWVEEVPDYYQYVEAEIMPYLEATSTFDKLFGLSTDAVFEIAGTYGEQINNEKFTGAEYLGIKAIFDAGIIKPEAGKFYRVKNNYNGKYMRVTAGVTRGAVFADLTAEEAAKDASALFYITENDSKPYMTSQGQYLNWVYTNWDGYEGWTSENLDKYAHFIPAAPGVGAFSIAYGNGDGSYAYALGIGFYALKSSESTVVAGSTTDQSSELAQWTFEEAEDLALNLNNGGDGSYYATLCVPFDVTISGAKAYTLAESATAGYLTPTEVTTVEAGTPVMLKGDAATATATIGTAYVNAPTTGTALTGSFFSHAVADGELFLGRDGTTVGFYKWTGTTLAANRAYVAADSEARGLAIRWDDTDAIQAVEAAEDTMAPIYNLAGQRVTKAQRGIYVINGKKVVIK